MYRPVMIFLHKSKKKKLLFPKDLYWFAIFHYSHLTEFNETLYTRTSYVDVHAHGIFWFRNFSGILPLWYIRVWPLTVLYIYLKLLFRFLWTLVNDWTCIFTHTKFIPVFPVNFSRYWKFTRLQQVKKTLKMSKEDNEIHFFNWSEDARNTRMNDIQLLS